VQKHLKEARLKVTAYESFCRKLGGQPADIALAWLLHNPVVTAPIIGPRTMEQLEGSLRALRIRLGKAELARLDAIWPGPGGEAPEAYAW
jgi:aryl-alcohol dehydrogenase-like predicted oxidoreductase